MREMLKHLLRVQERASKLSFEQARVFCLLCAERQKFAYDKSTTVVRPEDSDRARKYLDALWLQNVPLEPVPLVEATFDAEDAAANFVYTLEAITEINLVNYPLSCKVVAEFSMNILDSLAYSVLRLPVGSFGDEVVDSSLFVSTEIARQSEDLDELARAVLPINLEAFKAKSQMDLTLGAWFSED